MHELINSTWQVHGIDSGRGELDRWQVAGVWHFSQAVQLGKSQLDREALSLYHLWLGLPMASLSPAEGTMLGEVL